MDRQLLESLYYKQKELRRSFLHLCSRNPEFMSSELIAPEFILQEKLELDQRSLISETSHDPTQSLADTLTLCSNLSRVDTYRVLYKEVFNKRNLHSPFAELEKDTNELLQWFYFEEKTDNLFGPFSSTEMDQRFKWGILKEITTAATLLPKAWALARLLESGPPLVYAAIKEIKSDKARCLASSTRDSRRSG